jgi:hypothetical protein
MVETLLLHPLGRSVYWCRVRVNRDGLMMCRVSVEANTPIGEQRSVESEPIAIRWRSLRGFSADESHVAPTGVRLQVLEIDTDDGVLTLLAPVAEISVLFGEVGRWSSQWRMARSPLGVVLGGRRKRHLRQVA